MRQGRTETHGLALWRDTLERRGDGETGMDRVEVRFTGRPLEALAPVAAGGAVPRSTAGRPARPPRRRLLDALGFGGVEVAWARQVHSARVLEATSAESGGCGEGDALVTDRSGLALSVVTADCVPVLLAGTRPGDPVAAVHAGWRGIAQGVVAATLEWLQGRDLDPGRLMAWIGPAIGPCCYEVGPEVVERVTAAVDVPAASLVHPNPRPGRPNPHLDLTAAVASQLRTAGVEQVETLDLCTRCREDLLWSFRRDGPDGGRNVAFVWVERLPRR